MQKSNNKMTEIERIRRTKAYKKIKKDLLDQLKRSGNLTEYYIDLVEDYMKMYIVKELANKDIENRGTSVEYNNGGGQKGWKKNDSVDQLLKTNQQMIKLLDMLGISPIAGDDEDDCML